MAMADIACHGKDSPVRLAEISQRQDIALNYLEQIFVNLKKSKLVISVRGPGGGYKLTSSSDKIFISDVLSAITPELKMTRCQANENCVSNNAKCLTHKLWVGLENNIMNYLSSVSLQDIAAGNIQVPILQNKQRFIEVL